MGARGGDPGGARLQKARAAHPNTPLRAHSWEVRQTRPSARTIRLGDQPGAERCCGCGVCAVGAAAPRQCTTSGLGCVRRQPSSFVFPSQHCLTTSLLVSLRSSASRAFAGGRELDGIPVGATPCGHSGSLRLGLRWPLAQGVPPSPTGPRFAPRILRPGVRGWDDN